MHFTCLVTVWGLSAASKCKVSRCDRMHTLGNMPTCWVCSCLLAPGLAVGMGAEDSHHRAGVWSTHCQCRVVLPEQLFLLNLVCYFVLLCLFWEIENTQRSINYNLIFHILTNQKVHLLVFYRICFNIFHTYTREKLQVSWSSLFSWPLGLLLSLEIYFYLLYKYVYQK